MTRHHEFIGLENIIEQFFGPQDKPSQTYPPYNLIKKKLPSGDIEYSIELAVAGFKPDELDVSIENSKLKIMGEVKRDLDTREYIHRGISARWFTREFVISENVSVDSVTFADGILSVKLLHKIPESQKPRKFEIKQVSSQTPVADSTTTQQLLTE